MKTELQTQATATRATASVGDYTPRGGPITGRQVLIGMILFFGVIIAANMAMLTAALNSWGGLVVKNSYVASQRFGQDVAAAEAQSIQSWRLEIAHPSAGGPLTLSVLDEAGAPLSGLNVTLLVGRPTHEREDQVLALTAAGPGLYRAEEALAPGTWRAEVVAAEAAGGLAQRRSLRFSAPRAQ